MEHLERQSAEIQYIMYYKSDKYTFDRVSGAEGEEDMPIISSNLQHITNAHSNTNTPNLLTGGMILLIQHYCPV